jgi:hypothetical protein
MPQLLALVATLFLLSHHVTAQSAGSSVDQSRLSFETARPAEAIATVIVRCDRCAWDVEGREAVMLTVSLDGRYVQHLPVLRTGRAEYRILLGRVEPGAHALKFEEDRDLSARELGGGSAATIESTAIHQVVENSPEHRALSLAPFIYARPNTVGRFTDVPVFMWYEVEPTERGTRYRYSVVFTNEDGGTPADRLMATWGRTTDIEYVYSVEVDERGEILAEDMQGPDHKILPFRGKREVRHPEILPFRGNRDARHPLLWVVTDNNMVLDAGSTRVRYAPAPVAFPLRDVSREAVMDQHPWLYGVMAMELAREGKLKPDAPPGNGLVPDPRRFVYVEGCGEAGDTGLAFAVRVNGEWIRSDRNLAEYRIARDGCFRAAIPLPDQVTAADIRALRVQAFARADKSADAVARLTRINKMFMLDGQYQPGVSVLSWQGAVVLRAEGPGLEIPVR